MIMVPIPILIIAIMVGMIILGLLRPPLTVILPLLGIYVILMLVPYMIPNLTVNQYLNVRYMVLPVLGLAIGYGISLFVDKYMNVNIPSLLKIGQGKSGRKQKTKAKRKVEKKPEIKPEDIERIVYESIDVLKLGISTNETLGTWVEYYEGWTDVVLGISRRFLSIKDSAEMINKEAMVLSRIKNYETKALSLGFALREESAYKRQRKSKSKADYEDRLVVYVRPEDLASEFMASAQLINNYMEEFNKVFENLVRDKEISQYMVNARVLVLYVDGIPRKFIILHGN
ncbi:MAG: hypothetical protein ACP5NQ_01115 [Vulcanisaeta sp.]